MQDPNFPYGAQIAWGKEYDTITAWNNVSIWGIELFGLPGDRYVTDVNVNDMTWWFRDPRDQTVFVLRNGQARCIELELNT